MDRKQGVIANVKYQSAKGTGAHKLKAILRYVQYRDDRDGHIPQQHGLERWVDHGLGDNFQTIASNCEAFKSEHVQAFTLVINPNPDLVAFIPEDGRETFVRELTERTLEGVFEARGMDPPQWAYALHRRETSEDGRDNPHTHIILPGTYESWADGGRLPLYFNNRKNENHIEMLHKAAQQQMEVLLERYVGPDWEKRYDDLHLAVDENDVEQQTNIEALPPVPDDNPHALAHGGPYDSDFQVWVAIQGDLEPDRYHVGFIMHADEENLRSHTFIPTVEDLSKEDANMLAGYMKQLVQHDPEEGIDRAAMLADMIQQAEPHQRHVLIQTIQETLAQHDRDSEIPPHTPDIER